MTYDTKGVWRFYEIKTSKADFNSKAKKTFLGHFNYYVMPRGLYEEVKNMIPNHIGVHNGNHCIKNAKKQKLSIDEHILKNSMIRSLSRENEKFIKTNDIAFINKLNSQILQLEKKSRAADEKYLRYSNAIFEICDKYHLDYNEVRQIVREK